MQNLTKDKLFVNITILRRKNKKQNKQTKTNFKENLFFSLQRKQVVIYLEENCFQKGFQFYAVVFFFTKT